ncbi:MAG: hypothetical protein KAQ98_05665 [Bacteriovoracaceae bacterium]|nr:hypothetical protein [Bacteriovoracaceae bacterium]
MERMRIILLSLLAAFLLTTFVGCKDVEKNAKNIGGISNVAHGDAVFQQYAQDEIQQIGSNLQDDYKIDQNDLSVLNAEIPLTDEEKNELDLLI